MPVRLSSHRLPFSLSIGAAPIPPPPITLGELLEIYYYDRDGALGTVAGGLLLVFVWQNAIGTVVGADVQDDPEQASPLGSVIGGDVQDDEPQHAPMGTVIGGSVQDDPIMDTPLGSVIGGDVQDDPEQTSPTGTISGGTVLPPEARR